MAFGSRRPAYSYEKSLPHRLEYQAIAEGPEKPSIFDDLLLPPAR
jgi:hypothetical protein